MKTGLRITADIALFGLLVFGPAGTFDYWQAWMFLATFAVLMAATTIYLALTDPAALRRRMRAGPIAETRPVQKIVISVMLLSLLAMMAFSAFDHRFGWSRVPAAVCLIGDALVAIGFGVVVLVVLQNSYAAATITVEAGQKVASSGLYALVRHPMYTGDVIMTAGIPLALGSYWGLAFLVPSLMALVVRTRDEEKLLTEELAGYREYVQRVRYRLVPRVW